jgi:hypothetical protein
MPSRFDGTKATYAPKPFVDPVLFNQTFRVGGCGGTIALTRVGCKNTR